MLKQIKNIFRQNRVIIVASAHKVGSTWVYNILKDYFNCQSLLIPFEFRHNPNNNLLSLNKEGVEQWITGIHGPVIIKSHDFPPHWKKPDKIQFVTAYRDLRDIMISSIFYIENLDLERGGWPQLKELQINDKINYWMERNQVDFKLLEEWYFFDDAHKLCYEGLLDNPEFEFSQLIKLLSGKLNRRKFNRILAKNAFEAKTKGRKRGHEDLNSFFRKGISGDWKNYFNEEITKKFKTLENGKWNDLLIKLGYESGLDW